MTRVRRILGIALLVGALGVPVFAWAHGWERGHHMMGHWGGDPEYGYERGYGSLTEEQRSKLEALDRKFYDGTANLRNEIWTKSDELDRLLYGPDPDREKVKSLQKELSDFRTKIDEKRLNYELEARKLIPDDQRAGRYGRGYYGRHMGGYGPGSCWN